MKSSRFRYYLLVINLTVVSGWIYCVDELSIFWNSAINLFLVFSGFVLSIAYFWSLALQSKNRSDCSIDITDRNPGQTNRLLPALLALASLALIPAGMHYSDDAIRHVIDGFFISRGIDVYSIAAESLLANYEHPFADDIVPNHAWSATIYFPFTQIQAVAGSLLHPRWGFFLVYHSICAAFLYYLLSARPAPFHVIFYLPFFWIALASKHADVQGLLMLLAVWQYGSRHFQILQTHRFNWPVITFRGKHSSSAVFLSGVLIGILPGIKPEGWIWAGLAGMFSILLLVQNRSSDRMRLFVIFLAGLFAVFLFQVMLTVVYFSFHEQAAGSFLDTAYRYRNFFVGYHPLMDYLLSNGYSIEEAGPVVRLTLASLVIVSAIGLVIYFRPNPFPALALFLLLLFFSQKLSFQPWYFLWIFPVLVRVSPVSAGFLLALLPLWYLPVHVYRDFEYMPYQLFYCFLSVSFLLGILLTVLLKKTFLINWDQTRFQIGQR